MMRKRVVFLDFGVLKENLSLEDNSLFVSLGHYTHLANKDTEYLYFDHSDDVSDTTDLIKLCLNWSRDRSGIDRLAIEGISPANWIARRLLIMMFVDYKNYKNLMRYREFDEWYFPKGVSPSFIRMAHLFGKKVIFYELPVEAILYTTSSPERTLIVDFPPIHFASFFLRLIQKPLFFIVRRFKTLVFFDWLNEDFAKKMKSALLQNSLKIWRAFYFSESVYKLPNFPELTTVEVNSTLPNEFQCYLVSSANSLIAEHRKIFSRTFGTCSELLKYYSPEQVILPGETFYPYVMVAQICRKLSIKSILMIDGYQHTLDDAIIYNDESNKVNIFDHFFAHGSAHRDLLIEQGVKESQIEVISPSIVSLYKSKPLSSPIFYDAIVLDYNPHLTDLNSRWDMSAMFVFDIVCLLRELGYQKIGVKVKSKGGININDRSLDERRIIDYFKLRDAKPVDLIGGKFSDCVHSAKFIIGQFSTATLEAFYNDIPFYAYEPLYNGKSDQMISSSKSLNSGHVARSIQDLKKLILGVKVAITHHKDYVIGSNEKGN